MGNSLLSADVTSLAADGVATAGLTVTLRDACGQALRGKMVKLVTNRNVNDDVISPATATTAIDGTASFSLLSAKPGTTTVHAEDNLSMTVSPLVNITFNAGAPDSSNSAISASRAKIPTDNATTATITVTLRDANNNPVSGQAVAFSTDQGVLSATSATTDGSGEASVTLKASAGTGAMVWATAGISLSKNIVFYSPLQLTPGAPSVEGYHTLQFVGSGGYPGASKTYSIASGNGTIHSSSGLYGAGAVGSAQVQVSDGYETKVANVTITPSKTALLLHFDEPAGSGLILDHSSNGLAVNKRADASLSSLPARFGTGAATFNGTTNSSINVPSLSALFAGTDFTIDFWLKVSGLPSTSTYYDIFGLGSGTSNQVYCNVDSSGHIGFVVQYAGAVKVSLYSIGAIDTPSWNHVALVRSGPTWTLYINGNNASTGSYSGTGPSYVTGLFIGDDWQAGGGLMGSIDEFRVSQSARWSGGPFSPPASPYFGSALSVPALGESVLTNSLFSLPIVGGASPYQFGIDSGLGSVNPSGVFTAPASAGTSTITVEDSVGAKVFVPLSITDPKLLVRFEGDHYGTTFEDSSPSNYSLNRVGSPYTWTSEKKVGSSSAYFDSVSYLTTPGGTGPLDGAGNFTADFWMYLQTPLPGQPQYLFGAYWADGKYVALSVEPGGTFKLAVCDGLCGNSYSPSATYLPASWHHVTLVRSGAIWTVYYDLRPVVTSLSTSGNAFGSGSVVTIGGMPNVTIGVGNAATGLYGFMDDFRLSHGARPNAFSVITP